MDRLTPPRLIVALSLVAIAILAVIQPSPVQGTNTNTTNTVYLPAIYGAAPTPTSDPSCQSIPNVTYGKIPIVGPPANPPPAANFDLNLDLRGWEPTNAPLTLVTYNGPADPLAPQLWGLFTNDRVPTITAVYQVNTWNTATNQPGPPITDWPVTLAGFQVTPGEVIQTPPSGYDIGQGHTALVLYATTQEITLTYTGNDSIVSGYAIHIEGICVEPPLLALFNSLSGTNQLPALANSQPLGRANGTEIDVAIRDAGSFLDPRSQKDWWQG